MNYYLLRQAASQKPASAPPNGAIISSDEAMEWDVTMILKSGSQRVSPGILYRKGNDKTMFYIHEVEEYAYDMMDAVDIPHAIRDELWVVVPQEIFTSTTWSKISRESTGTRGQRKGVFLHTTYIGGKLKGGSAGMQLYECMG